MLQMVEIIIKGESYLLFVVKNVIGTYRLPIDGGYQLEVT